MAGYTVIDFETTGFSPRHGDRVLEVGVAKVAHDGEIYDAWSTLINPKRDVGASSIHGISARDVLHAPTFDQIAPRLLQDIDGRILAAHNASFDLRFLAAELARCGYLLEGDHLEAVCTMRWAGAYLRAPSRRLCDCCTAADIELDNAHSALADALATAQLLAHYLLTSGYRPGWQEELAWSRAYHWPRSAGCGQVPLLERSYVPQRAYGWLDRIVARLPHAADPVVDSYLAVLEMAMLDGYLSAHEQDQLVAVAEMASLTRPRVMAIHADYLAAIAVAALEDGVVTDEERSDLARAAELLGLAPHDVEAALASAIGDPTAKAQLTTTGIELRPGDRVVFTGEMNLDRATWERRALAAGLCPGGVAKTTRLVVAADPDSLSGKAAKARAYGIPIVNEAAFARIIASLESARLDQRKLGG